MRPPVGVSSPVSRQVTETPSGHGSASAKASIELALVARAAARSARCPDWRRSASRARGSARRRSPRAAWGCRRACSCSRVPRPPQRISTVSMSPIGMAAHDAASPTASRLGPPMSTLPPSIFKAYDIRGIHGDDLDEDGAELLGRAFVRVLADLEGKPAGRPARRPGPRHAPDGAGDGRPLSRGHGRRGRPRARRRRDRHRDALPPRRLARPRRRDHVHRLAQPQGLHGRQARAARGARALRRRGHRGHARPDRGRPRRARPGGGSLGGGRHLRRLPGAGAVGHRRGRDQAAAGRRRRRQRHGRTDGRPAARAPRARPRHGLLDAGRELPRPRAQPAAGGEPDVHHRPGPLRGRRSRHRLGRRRRPLLLHRRAGPLRRRRLPDRADGPAAAAQGARRDDPLRRARLRARSPTSSRPTAAPR